MKVVLITELCIQSLFILFQTDFPVRERIFLLLDATQTSLGGSSGKFPQYYTAYYDLVVSAKFGITNKNTLLPNKRNVFFFFPIIVQYTAQRVPFFVSNFFFFFMFYAENLREQELSSLKGLNPCRRIVPPLRQAMIGRWMVVPPRQAIMGRSILLGSQTVELIQMERYLFLETSPLQIPWLNPLQNQGLDLILRLIF